MVLRISVIPGAIDVAGNLEDISIFLRGPSRTEVAKLLPYNRLAESTCIRFSLDYRLCGLQTPGLARMKQVESSLGASGWTVRTVWGLCPTV